MSTIKTAIKKLAKGNRYEKPDPSPRKLPVGYKARSGPTMHERMRAMLREERSMEKMRAAGIETEEEANDFDIEDDETARDPLTPHELADLHGTANSIMKKEIGRGPGPTEAPTPPGAPEPLPVPDNQKGSKVSGAIGQLARLFAGKSEKEIAKILEAEEKQ